MKLVTLFAIVFFAMNNQAIASKGEHSAHHQNPEMSAQSGDNPLKLKDGSLLFISQNGTMRMVDKMGKPISMREGVEMTLEDGSIILMHNKRVFRHIHKGRP